ISGSCAREVSVIRSAGAALQGLAESLDVGEDGVSSKLQGLDRALGRLGMSAAAGVLDNDRNKAEVGGVPCGRLDTDFHCDADKGNCSDAAVAQSDRKRRALQGGHGELVED